MNLFLLSIAIVTLAFGFVLIFGAPYLPTLKKQAEQALDLLNLKPGQTLLELGSGDGRILVAAAKRGLNAVGYELNPFLFLFSKIITWPYRKNVKVYFANYWQAEWPKANAIYVFLLQKYMNKLDKKIKSTYRNKKIKMVSLAFAVPSKKPAKTTNGLYLYHY